MSYETWHNYGYGIRTSEIKDNSVERLQSLLALAPRFRSKVEEWLAEQDISEPNWNDYMEYDQDYYLGLATILKEVVEEAEKITLTACDDRNGATYLMYQPKYPWQLSDIDRNLTEDRLRAIFAQYVALLTDQEIDFEELSVKNGG